MPNIKPAPSSTPTPIAAAAPITDERMVAAGAPEEFVAQVLAHTAALRVSATRLTRNEADTADLLQDTVERALRSWHRFVPGTRMRSWLFTIMSRRFVDRCRRRRRETPLEAAEQDRLAASEPSPSSDEDEMPRWLRCTEEQVAAALATLDPTFREIYQLYAVDQLSYKAIADRVGVPLGTVATRLNRARLKLRAVLEAELGGEVKQ